MRHSLIRPVRFGTIARKVLAALVTDPVVLARVLPHWDEDGLFATTWENLIARWCLKYYKRYGQAPGRAVEASFAAWADRDSRDSETVTLVEKFLAALSDEHASNGESSNSAYLTDLAGQHFNAVRARKLADAIEGHLGNGEGDKAWEAMRAVTGNSSAFDGFVFLMGFCMGTALGGPNAQKYKDLIKDELVKWPV